MELNNKTLVEWLKDAPKELYPQQKKVDYYTDYAKLQKYLLPIHKEVTTGANLQDSTILLNDHGPDHIETVISRASFLVDGCKCQLKPYEVYILLCCIQLHDVGNIFGRYKHELKLSEVMKVAEGICGNDTVEAIKIKKIAETHGGKTNEGDKDKISKLIDSEDTLHGEIRPQLIASILRFADELADDKTRASRTLLIEGKIPENSEVFHAYAMCLDSVKIKHNEKCINLTFQIPKEFISREFGKMGEKVYLLNEIYERVLKMHYERIYCMRFSRNNIEIDNLSVKIEFYDKTMEEVFPKISFELRENGYPNSNESIFEMCKELYDNEGNKIDAEYVKSKIE